MTQSLGARATSLAASAALLGLAVFAAFSVSIQLGGESIFGTEVIDVVTLPPETPPPITRPTRTTPPPPTVTDEPRDTVLPIEPVTPTDVVDSVGPVDYGPPTPTITNPRWLRQPRDLASYYPSRALARDITGQVVLDCRVDVNGVLHCQVASETPMNWGFGDAALRIARDYRMVPVMQGGQAVEARYRMRVPFEVN